MARRSLVLGLAIVAFLSGRAAGAFICRGGFLRNDNYNICTANANTLDTATGGRTDFFCVSAESRALALCAIAAAASAAPPVLPADGGCAYLDLCSPLAHILVVIVLQTVSRCPKSRG